jgi:hypothetical protein
MAEAIQDLKEGLVGHFVHNLVLRCTNKAKECFMSTAIEN